MVLACQGGEERGLPRPLGSPLWHRGYSPQRSPDYKILWGPVAAALVREPSGCLSWRG